jgi:hypothetical protein
MQAPVGVLNRTTDGLVGSFRTLYGFHVDAAAAAEVQIRDGSATGTLIASSRLGAAGDDGPFWFDRGIATAGGIWVEVVSGAPTVAVYGV